MLTTLYCDASFCPHTNAGGWGVWLRSDRGRIVRGGKCPDYVRHPYEAELTAIFAGIWLAKKQWPETETVLVRSDCRDALALVQGTDPTYDPDAGRHRGSRALCAKIRELRQATGLRTIQRWVKGHQAGDDPPAWLNRTVDEIARVHMQRERLKRQRREDGAKE